MLLELDVQTTVNSQRSESSLAIDVTEDFFIEQVYTTTNTPIILHRNLTTIYETANEVMPALEYTMSEMQLYIAYACACASHEITFETTVFENTQQAGENHENHDHCESCGGHLGKNGVCKECGRFN